MSLYQTNIVLRSEISSDALLRLRFQEESIGALLPGQVRVSLDAAPVNPSDMGVLLASADLTTARTTGSGHDAELVVELAHRQLGHFERRVGLSLTVGNEGTGTVIDAAPDVQHMLRKTVAFLGGATYALYHTIAAADCLIVPSDVPPAARAGLFVNPLTALAMVEAMRLEGHRALVHNAAASNLGQMLVRICKADGVELVNIVRSKEQVTLLLKLGAGHVVDSRAADFEDQLGRAIDDTRATIAFDPVGGGGMTNILLKAMETSELRRQSSYSFYGSDTLKQVYIYGGLDLGVTTLERSNYGLAWAVGGFLLPHFLAKVGPATRARLLSRVAEEHDTTFASHYSSEVDLFELLQPKTLQKIVRTQTGEKYLVRINDDRASS